MGCWLSTAGQQESSDYSKIDSALSKEASISKPSEKIAYYLFVAQLYEDAELLSQAVDYLNKAYQESANAQLPSQQASALSALGDISVNQGNIPEAITYYERAMTLLRKKEETLEVSKLHEKIGKAHLKSYNFQDALESFNRALMLQSNLKKKELMAGSFTQIATVYRSNLGRAQEAISYYKKALELYTQIEDSTELAWTLNRIGNCHIDLGNYMEAYGLYQKALEIHKKEENIIGIVASYNNTGEVFRYQGNYKSALENYLKGLEISKEKKDDRAMSILTNNVGIIYYEQGNFEVALENFEKALEYGEKIDFDEGAVETYSYMGLTYKKKGEYEKAMEYFNQALNLSTEIGDLVGKAFALNSMGNLMIEQGNLERSKEFFSQALDLENTIKDKNGRVLSLNGLAEVALQQGNYFKAINLLTSSLSLAKEIGVKPQIAEIYLLLSKTYERQNRFATSLGYYKDYAQLNDSLRNSKVTQQIEVMQQKFSAEQREKEMQLLRKERELQSADIEKQQAIIKEQSFKQTVTAVALVLFVIAAILGWYGYNERKKAFDTLAIQKKEIEAKNKDITDSIQYSKRIQRALLTSDEYLSKIVPEHFIYYQPKDIVSGDFYWGYQNSRGRTILAAVDCTGHGVPGALMSMIGMSLLNEIVMEHKLEHSNEILDELSIGVIEALKQRSAEEGADGMDISLISWHQEKGEVEFSGAHNPLIIVKRDGTLIEHKGDKQPIGYFIGEAKPFTKAVYAVEPGDMIYLFSDGYQDQFGEESNKKFKYANFKTFLQEISPLSLAAQKDRLHSNFKAWKGNLDQLDDICIIGVRA